MSRVSLLWNLIFVRSIFKIWIVFFMMTSHGNCICMIQVILWIYLVRENDGCWGKTCGRMLLCWDKNPCNTPQSPYSMFIIAIQWGTFVVRIYKFALFLSDGGFTNDGFPKGLLSRERNSQSRRVIHCKEEDTWMTSLWQDIHVTW